ncbi:tonsoku-like protein [Dinothrombium tinctorium]|uniref:Tonsoku-like protein n=1 Tax=Dinothrombium tinctorium TaxID=1965070 RepID=A0A443QNP3_9ACAR|nr:tonsoku-like protein [Dinothrombium tinctorium]RWS04635.1 tonsoku-like protein [Dinothrombium tinctorium]RWS05027.1 tonsoku-like protein [Dinothrombium tinctorium]
MEKELLNLERDKIKAKNSKQYKEAAEICNYRGVLFASKGRFADALNEHNEELHFCRLNRDILGESIACRKIGECYAEMEQFDEALEKQMRYWKLAEKANDAVEVQRAWTTLGRTYFLQYSSDTSNTQALSFAETATRKSLQVAEKLKTNSAIKEKDLNEMICRSYLNLALIYEANGNTECVECYLEAIKLAKKYNFKEDLYRCEMNLANFYLKTDPFYVHLLKLFDNAIKDAKELKNSAFLCEAYLSKAKALLLRTDYAGSCYCFKKAFFSQSPVEEDRENARKCSKCVSRILRNLKELNESQSMQVKMDLCDKLADINDRGGQFCEGITPLHDACINGHTNVIRVLLRKGANVTALDNSGNTPLDCLKNCRSRLDNLSSSEEEDYDSVARELENAMKKVGYDFKQSKSLKRRSFDLPFEQNERDSISRNPNLSRKIHRKQKLTSTKSYCEENFVSEYECAMMSLRRQNDPGYDPKRRRLSPTASYNVSPLLDESEVLIDDWLIDDTGSSSKQALSMDRFRNKPRETLRSTGESSSRLRQNFTSCHISKDKNEERRKVDESESDMIECESNTSDNDSTCDVNLLETCETVTESEMCPEINIDNQNYFSESNSVSTTSSSRTFEQNVSNKMSNFHVRVHIEGIILLINVTDKESTIRWLAEATSQRYYQMKQMKPTLSLKTRDGALLCFDDKIIDVLMDDNLQLDAIVELWESQSPYERFIDQCKFLKVTPQPELETILRMTSENGLLNLNHTLLPQNQLKPLLNAIKHQEIIDCVDLSYSNILFIDRSSEFISTILSLPRLQQLNLECAGVTMSHLRVISTSKSNVNQLNLSYNSLNDSNSEILTQVFAKFAYLKKIDLRFCDFTSNLFTQSFLQSLEKSALDEVLIDEFCKSEISDTNLNSSKVRFCNI